MEHNFIENELVILSKATIDRILELKEVNIPDVIALYTFYYYTAKWQKTNQPKSTTGYTAKGLNITEERVVKAKKALIDLGLIENIRNVDEKGKVTGWYIKINYIFWNKIANTEENHTPLFSGVCDSNPVVKADPNALNTNRLNALITNTNSEFENSQSDEITYEEEFPVKKKSKDNKKEIYNRIIHYYVSLTDYTGDVKHLLVYIKGMWELCEKKKIQNPEEEIKARIKYAKDYFESKGLDWSLKAVQTHWNKILDYARN